MSENDIIDDRVPVLSEKAVTLVFACNDDYVIHLYTVFNSIKINNASKKKYDVIILQNDISQPNKDLLVSKMGDENFIIRFFDMKHYLNENKMPLHGHVSVETYFRYYIPTIMSQYDKALYLDVDIIINSDLSELYDTDVGHNCIVATRDIGMISQYYSTKYRRKYFDEVLKLKNPNGYFQAGVILLNIPELKKNLEIEKTVAITQSRHWDFMDQDVLNMVLEGKIGFVGQEWDIVLYTDEIKDAPKDMYMAYQNALRNPKIIHYAGNNKPWDTDDVMFVDYYKKYLYEINGRNVSSKKNTLPTKFLRILRKYGLRSAFYSTLLWAKSKIRR